MSKSFFETQAPTDFEPVDEFSTMISDAIEKRAKAIGNPKRPLSYIVHVGESADTLHRILKRQESGHHDSSRDPDNERRMLWDRVGALQMQLEKNAEMTARTNTQNRRIIDILHTAFSKKRKRRAREDHEDHPSSGGLATERPRSFRRTHKVS